MVKVIGSQSGRVFMAGSDGNMYELNYKSSESPWAAVFGTGRTHKCQKINHSSWNWKLVHLVPPFLQTILDVNDSLIDLTMDDMRNVLYSISTRGVLSAFYLGPDSKAVSLPIVRELKIFEEIQRFLSYQIPPESSPQASVFRDIRSMAIIGVFVIPLTESRSVHLMVILNNGIRIYLRLIGGDRLPYSPGYGMGGNSAPVGVEIVYLRNPPSPDAVR
jgi:nuclear pore complex protein Nup155